MKYLSLFILILSAVLIIIGCGKQDPMSLESTQIEPRGPLAKATSETFVATLDVTNIDDPGEMWITGGVLHIRGRLRTGPITGDIVGTGTLLSDAEVVLETGIGNARGSFTFAVNKVKGQAISGIWEGRFEAHVVDYPAAAVFSAHFQGQGNGDLAGTKIRGTATNEATPGILVLILTGNILTPK